MKRLWLLLLVVILIGVACTQAPAETPTPAEQEMEEEEAPPPEEEGGEETEAMEEEAAAEGQRWLRVGFSFPTMIDPAVGNDFSSSHALPSLYDTLIFPNAEAGYDPWLAESWDVSDDGLTYTFHLRDGIAFHDGSDVQASDVVYSYERLKEVGEGYSYLIPEAEVNAVDERTVEFTLPEPSGLFLPSLIRLYVVNEELVRENTNPDGPYGDNGDYGRDWLLTHDAGSGPYQVVEFRLEESLLMEKFDEWWNASEFHPEAPDMLQYLPTVEPATARALMQNKELEITDQWQTVEAYQALDELEGVDIMAFPSLLQQYLMVNNRKAPTDDINCRKALAYGFDYDAVVTQEWEGTPKAVAPVPASLGGAALDLDMPTLDLDTAREYLEQCQYADELDQYPIEFLWNSDFPVTQKAALLFQSNMAELGFTVELTGAPWLTLVERTSSEETSPHIVPINVSTDLPEAGLMLQQRYHSSTAPTWQQNEWLLDEDLDARIEDALATPDQEERFAKYGELQADIVARTPSLYLWDLVEKHAVQDYLDWQPTENSFIMGYQLYAPRIGVSRVIADQ